MSIILTWLLLVARVFMSLSSMSFGLSESKVQWGELIYVVLLFIMSRWCNEWGEGRVVYKWGRSSTSPVVLTESSLDNPLRSIVFKLKHFLYLCCAVFFHEPVVRRVLSLSNVCQCILVNLHSVIIIFLAKRLVYERTNSTKQIYSSLDKSVYVCTNLHTAINNSL